MSKRRGLSAEEKRQKMLELFFEKKEFFQLKELEKLGPKEKGVVSQSVKDVIQSLVDDELVETDKIGTSVYFWAYPSKASNARKHKLTDIKENLSEIKKKKKATEEKVKAVKVGREESDDRDQVLSELALMQKKKQELQTELEKYKDCDPEVLEDKKKQIIVAREAANRWTDNIFTIQSWCKNKFYIEPAVLNKQFGIPEELEYID